MTEQIKACWSCVHAGTQFVKEPCAGCVNYSHWTPKTSAAPTLAEVDESIVAWSSFPKVDTILRAFRQLVEAEECKAAIEAAGCWWEDGSRMGIVVGGAPTQSRFNTWPEARRWAEEQKAKREAEKWSKPIRAMGFGEMRETLLVIGGDLFEGPHSRLDTYLRGFAAGAKCHNLGTDKVWLGDGPMPE